LNNKAQEGTLSPLLYFKSQKTLAYLERIDIATTGHKVGLKRRKALTRLQSKPLRISNKKGTKMKCKSLQETPLHKRKADTKHIRAQGTSQATLLLDIFSLRNSKICFQVQPRAKCLPLHMKC
jgi:hypothetical protein